MPSEAALGVSLAKDMFLRYSLECSRKQTVDLSHNGRMMNDEGFELEFLALSDADLFQGRKQIWKPFEICVH